MAKFLWSVSKRIVGFGAADNFHKLILFVLTTLVWEENNMCINNLNACWDSWSILRKATVMVKMKNHDDVGTKMFLYENWNVQRQDSI